MNWQDKGYLLSISKYSENSAIVNLLTKDHGKVSGIIFGATSRKNKSYLIPGNKLHINYSSKNENKIGNFQIEIIKINTPHFFDNRIKLTSILYSIEIIKLLTPENQINQNIYNLLKKLFIILNNNIWLKNFILWELKLFKYLGYELNFQEFVKNTKNNGVNTYISKNDPSKVIPNFLINNDSDLIKKDDFIDAFEIIGDFLHKSILNDKHISAPDSRNEFLNLLRRL